MATLHVLGAGTPQPLMERWGSSYVLEIGEDLIMVDCGPAATHKFVQAGLSLTDLEWLFFTHHHSDHNVDYPCLMLFRWDRSTGEPPLNVIGPPPTEAFTEKLFGENGAYADDIRARIEDIASQRCHVRRGGSLPRPGPQYEARDVEPGEVIEGSGWTATCARSRHMQPLLWPLAWRFDWDGGSVCFTGDTAPCEDVTELARGAHTVVASTPEQRDAMHEDIATCIFNVTGAAELARDAGVRRLVLSHLTAAPVRNRESTIAEVRAVYDGELVIADEGMQLEV